VATLRTAIHLLLAYLHHCRLYTAAGRTLTRTVLLVRRGLDDGRHQAGPDLRSGGLPIRQNRQLPKARHGAGARPVHCEFLYT